MQHGSAPVAVALDAPDLECAARFDVIAVTWPDDHGQPTIEHFQNAFEPTGFSGMFS